LMSSAQNWGYPTSSCRYISTSAASMRDTKITSEAIGRRPKHASWYCISNVGNRLAAWLKPYANCAPTSERAREHRWRWLPHRSPQKCAPERSGQQQRLKISDRRIDAAPDGSLYTCPTHRPVLPHQLP